MTREERWTIVRSHPFHQRVDGPDLPLGESVEVVPAARLVEVEAENERLREALKRIASSDGEAAAPFVKIARWALEDADTA